MTDPMSEPTAEAIARAVHALQRRWSARLIETHISWVLLDGTHAWKVKKPVHLPFLDARTTATRRALCEAECTLNQRLAPRLYLDVRNITGSPDEPGIDGTGPALSPVLRMQQFPPGCLFTEQLAAGTLADADIDRLAHRLAAFHRAAPVAPAERAWGTAEQRAAALTEALGSLAQVAVEHTARVAALQCWVTQAIEPLRPVWQARHAAGHIRECHGDLHLANLIRLPDGEVTAFDCIEFDPALRWIDPITDIAFPVMDLAAHGRADLGWRLLNAWLDETGDHAGVAVLRADLVYRATVRALVARLRTQDAPPDALPDGPDYLALAERLAHHAPPTLTITHGLSGSGKSHQALRLLQVTGAIRLRADVERKRLFGLPAQARSQDHVPGGIYTAEATQRTYAHLMDGAAKLLQAGWPVILDAAFLRRAERVACRALADQHGARFRILHCEAPPAVLQQRLAHRAAQGQDPSEADAGVLAQQQAWAEPLTADELPSVMPPP